ncbi:MAG: glycosyltransferase family 4 protein, partial [Anaerolineaceae bacterium]|nr:glycosyltransferase family 4 protein [Anaerolineaceae bacterium]
GFVPWGETMFSMLDEMDIFVLSSLSEGMPRALIEAMARGLPCISTAVSGAGELLGFENLVPIGQADLLAVRIAEILASPEKRSQLADQCWASVQDYRLEVLTARKKKFLLDFSDYVNRSGGKQTV